MKTTRKICGIALALICSQAGTLMAQILYVGNSGNNSIVEYGLNGWTASASQISVYSPNGIAVSGNTLFVTKGGAYNGAIGEYTASGATVNGSLVSGLSDPIGIAILGNDIFVANYGNGTSPGSVGEYTTSGATVNASLISGLNGPTGLAISGTNLFVLSIDGTLGEYTTSGAPVNASLDSGLDEGAGIAISGTNLFAVADYNLVEYTTSGASISSLNVGGPLTGVAVSGNDVFVLNYIGGVVSEYTTSGAVVNGSLISGLNHPWGLAIGPPSHPSFISIGVKGSTLNISATNGPAGGTYTLLESTNFDLPVAQWTPVLTNTFSINGNLSLSTNIINSVSPAEFYVLEVP